MRQIALAWEKYALTCQKLLMEMYQDRHSSILSTRSSSPGDSITSEAPLLSPSEINEESLLIGEGQLHFAGRYNQLQNVLQVHFLHCALQRVVKLQLASIVFIVKLQLLLVCL
jgi:hypothetical protein